MHLFGVDCGDLRVVRWSWFLIALSLPVLCDAVMAYFAKDRKLFWVGIAGTISGAFVPKRPEYPLYSSVEGAIMGLLHDDFEHTIWCAFGGMVVANSVYAYWRHKRKSSARIGTDPTVHEFGQAFQSQGQNVDMEADQS